MNYFLQDVAAYLYKKNGGDFKDTILVFPNRRARLFFNYFIAQVAKKPLWAPNYISITDFVQQLSGLQLADPLTLIFKLYKVFIEETQSKESFDTLYFLLETILADFDDIDKYQVDAEKLFSNLNDIKDIGDFTEYLTEDQLSHISEFWNIYNRAKPSDEKKDFSTLWRALNGIYCKFNELLQIDNAAYEGRLYLQALKNLYKGNASGIFNKQVVFVGFNALNRSEELLFEEYYKHGNALFFWDYAVLYIENNCHEAGLFLRSYIKRFPPPPDFTPSPHCSSSEQSIYVFSTPGNISQAKVIHSCLDHIGCKKITTPLQTALILADENLLLPVISSLPDSADKVNISLGYPIVDTAIYSLLISLSEMHNNRKVNNKGVGFVYYHRDFYNVFQHEVLREVVDMEYFKSFIKQCKSANSIYIDIEELTKEDILLETLFQPVSNARSFVPYIKSVIEVLVQQLNRNNTDSNRKLWETEIYHSVHKMLARLEALLNEVHFEINFTTITHMFRKLLQGMSVPFSGEPLEGLQLTGILETRTLDFENVIILSMNEGKFPKTTGVPSLIPYSLRRGYALPTHEHQDAIFAYYFYRLLHRARNVVLVYNSKTEGLQKGEASRYIQQLKYSSNRLVREFDMSYTIAPVRHSKLRAINKNYVSDKLNRYYVDERNSYLSPSALSCFIQCKLKYFFSYVQEIPDIKHVAENVESDKFGSILHKAIDIIYSDFENTFISEEAISSVLGDNKLLYRAIDKAFLEEYFIKPDNEIINYKGIELIVREVIIQYLKRILAYDKEHTPFKIHSLEKQYVTTISVQGLNKKVRVGGKIDRLDKYNDYYRVIDYKTGSPKLTFKSLENLFQYDSDYKLSAVFQSLMYSWLIVQQEETLNVQPHLYFVREMDSTNTVTQIKDTAKGAGVVTSMEKYSEEFGSRLSQLISDIYNPLVSFDQTANIKTCEFCSYKSICMRTE